MSEELAIEDLACLMLWNLNNQVILVMLMYKLKMTLPIEIIVVEYIDVGKQGFLEPCGGKENAC